MLRELLASLITALFGPRHAQGAIPAPTRSRRSRLSFTARLPSSGQGLWFDATFDLVVAWYWAAGGAHVRNRVLLQRTLIREAARHSEHFSLGDHGRAQAEVSCALAEGGDLGIGAVRELGVVAEVLAHAESRSEESLGVITMGIEHADRIEAALDQALGEHRDLAGFFAEDRDERFFVKNLERVQGGERDAIILSLGYGRGSDGRMRHHFGPLNLKGGERRLNVAVTRAKRRMTLVSSFGSRDLDPGRLNAEGAKLLRRYLEFAESEGKDLGTSLADHPPLNPFEVDVRDRLTAAGLPLVCQYGVAGYRIDFVAAHPERPGQMVLAVEADGAS
ncbi:MULTISPECIES: AAA domain-containing protein [unclassified Nocardiopsis]|uniref:AAA domain-containing protein n=1 Tax=unclassified Nocardiopsis TaxID=2649073 RepID=UPI001359D56E|nr:MULTISPECIES: AAA domain-containing protein [unclassified Nocardiopsis]